jgi:hypothetical protein
MFRALGDQMVEAAGSATDSVVLVAPFVKAHALGRVLEALPARIPVKVVTRWIPEEIAAGVSDLEAWELLRLRESATLSLYPSLHAKYFRFDDRALVGSANLTARALGWTSQPNLELLVERPAQELVAFERHLRDGAIAVDEDLYLAMRVAAEAVAARMPDVDRQDESARLNFDSLNFWVPQSLHVEHLYKCYLGREDEVVTTTYRDGLSDLAALSVPSGLSRADFDAFVAARLQQSPVFAEVDVAAKSAVNRSRGAQILVDLEVVDGTAAPDAWDIFAAWLTAFMPNRFRTKHTIAGPALERSQVI